MLDNDFYAYQLKYVDNFKCDGNKCNAKCCHGWRIQIQDDTYEKYKQIKDDKLRLQILSAFQKDDKGYYAKLTEREGACPLLCKDNLCFIQRNMGEQYLSETCKFYPRHIVSLSGILLHLLNMSCPLAADAALFSLNGMNLQKINTKKKDVSWQAAYKLNTNDISTKGDIEEIMVISSLSILQNSTYKWEERLILLGLFLDKADELINLENCKEKIIDLAIAYQSEEFHNQAVEFFNAFQFDSEGNKKIMQSLFSLSSAVIVGENIGVANIVNASDEEFNLLHRQIFSEFGQAVINYAIQEFLFIKYPVILNGSLMHNYFTYLLMYKEFEYNLYKYVKEHGSINKSQFLQIVNFFGRVTNHDIELIRTVEKKAREYEEDPLGFMQMLIRLY